MKNERSQAVGKAVSKVLFSLNSLKEKPNHVAASMSTRSSNIAIRTALTIAHHVLDMTLDEQGSLFYASSLGDFATEIVSAVNEETVIDIDLVNELIYPLWIIRYRVATGTNSPFHMHSHYADVLSPKYADPIKTYLKEIDARKDIE